MKKELIEKELLKRRLAKKINESKGGKTYLVESNGNKFTLTESELNSTLIEAIRKTIEEGFSFKHGQHSLNDYLDDDDFLSLVNRVKSVYDADSFSSAMSDAYTRDEMEMEIEELVRTFVDEEAVSEFGYKYGTNNYRHIASQILDYILNQ